MINHISNAFDCLAVSIWRSSVRQICSTQRWTSRLRAHHVFLNLVMVKRRRLKPIHDIRLCKILEGKSINYSNKNKICLWDFCFVYTSKRVKITEVSWILKIASFFLLAKDLVTSFSYIYLYKYFLILILFENIFVLFTLKYIWHKSKKVC